jgi:hypothetical protein
VIPMASWWSRARVAALGYTELVRVVRRALGSGYGKADAVHGWLSKYVLAGQDGDAPSTLAEASARGQLAPTNRR